MLKNLSRTTDGCRLTLSAICLVTAGLPLMQCGSDEPLDPGEITDFTLRHDSGQDSSPTLAGGTYEAAARFTSSQLQDFAGLELVEVHFYIANKPEQCRVKIYGQMTANTPGSLLYSSDVTGALEANAWNNHELTQPITLTTNDIWISIEFMHSARQATIGCDPGPAVQDGDWLYDAADSTWRPLSQRTSISINWNVRGIAADPS